MDAARSFKVISFKKKYFQINLLNFRPVKGKENTFKVVDQIGPVEEESVLLDAEEQETEDECDEEKQEEILAVNLHLQFI